MKRLVFALVLAALAFAPSALGKELESVSVCGLGGCNSSDGGGSAGGGGGGAAFDALIRAFEGDPSSTGAATTVLDAVPAGEYYKLGLNVRGDDQPAGRFSLELWYVKPNLIRFLRDGAYPEPFKRLGPTAAALLQSLSQGVKPYAAPKVVSAYVNGKAIPHPQGLIELFSGLPSMEAPANASPTFANLYLKANRPNPWFSDSMEFLYLPDQQALFFDKPVKVPDEAARTIAATGGFSLPADGDRSWGRPIGIGILALALLLAVTLFLLRRRPQRAERAQTTTA
jgi:hypothetical protein